MVKHVLITLLTFLVVPLHAADISDLSYNLRGNTVIITNCDESASGKLVIPVKIEGNPVTSIGDWAFMSCTKLTSITIPDGVTSIGNNAFSDCTSLTNVTIPDRVTSIGFYAFSRCTNLTRITIGNGVTNIGNGAFSDCEGLTSVTIGDSVTSIGLVAFGGCSNLTSITIPDSVTSIGGGAFYFCSSLTSITFLGNAPILGGDLFFGLPAEARVIARTEAIGFGDRFGDPTTMQNLLGLQVVYVEMKKPFQLEVQISRLEGDHIALEFPTAAGNTYSIQGSSDMRSWELLESGIVGTGDDIQRTFTINGNESFFRILKNGLDE